MYGSEQIAITLKWYIGTKIFCSTSQIETVGKKLIPLNSFNLTNKVFCCKIRDTGFDYL